jgi:hypothetical protein
MTFVVATFADLPRRGIRRAVLSDLRSRFRGPEFAVRGEPVSFPSIPVFLIRP